MRRWSKPSRLVVLITVLGLAAGGLAWWLRSSPGPEPAHLFVYPTQYVKESPRPSRELSAAIDRLVTDRTNAGQGPAGRARGLPHSADTAPRRLNNKARPVGLL
ncbi:hypothetical protein, partial [Kitasatospora sp. NPDC093558]|uniref:hypothetical protein n=1 Tax=Kitasatospora sp. NPDC093558 TaxID=3155201 RepID=UPI00342BA272